MMALQGVEMVILGYNTPATNSQDSSVSGEQRMFHHRLVLQAAAHQNSTWLVAIAKAGVEDGHALIGGNVIVNPDGIIVAETSSDADELIVHSCNLDDCLFGKQSQLDFGRHRRIEHYGLITGQTGVVKPVGCNKLSRFANLNRKFYLLVQARMTLAWNFSI
jgi:predicted amidohydrolase